MCAQLGARFRQHEQLDLRLADIRRHPDHGAVLDGGMLARNLLHLSRRYVLAHYAHAVAHAAVEIHVAGRVPGGEIARVKCAGPEGLQCRVFFPEVPAGERTPQTLANDDLTALTYAH